MLHRREWGRMRTRRVLVYIQCILWPNGGTCISYAHRSRSNSNASVSQRDRLTNINKWLWFQASLLSFVRASHSFCHHLLSNKLKHRIMTCTWRYLEVAAPRAQAGIRNSAHGAGPFSLKMHARRYEDWGGKAATDERTGGWEFKQREKTTSLEWIVHQWELRFIMRVSLREV